MHCLCIPFDKAGVGRSSHFTEPGQHELHGKEAVAVQFLAPGHSPGERSVAG